MAHSITQIKSLRLPVLPYKVNYRVATIAGRCDLHRPRLILSTWFAGFPALTHDRIGQGYYGYPGDVDHLVVYTRAGLHRQIVK